MPGRRSFAKLRAQMSPEALAESTSLFIEAMGGELDIVARFPDHSVRIRNISDISDQSKHTKTA